MHVAIPAVVRDATPRASHPTPSMARAQTDLMREQKRANFEKESHMIDALIAGTLQGQPTEKTAKNGCTFVTAKVRALAAGNAELFVNVVTFSRSTGAALLSLESGDSVALTGTLTPKVWTDRDGCPRPILDLVANQVMTAYRLADKRKAQPVKPC